MAITPRCRSQNKMTVESPSRLSGGYTNRLPMCLLSISPFSLCSLRERASHRILIVMGLELTSCMAAIAIFGTDVSRVSPSIILCFRPQRSHRTRHGPVDTT
ncbi:hypothetical protein LZ31DRAFT_549142 [Colletotrichum somersetense]|nr:hypothetical protein LZ31DRAFT_549142 [Colletotrichum somersetense]